MNILRSNWGVPLLGALLYLATMLATMVLTPFRGMLPAVGTHDGSKPAGSIWSSTALEIDNLVAELKKEKESLALREKQLSELAEQLKKQRHELNQATQTVHQLQAEFDRNVARVREEEVPNLKKLAKVYATMSPEGAAGILSNMEDEQIVRFLVFMKEGETATILESMSKLGDAQSKRIAILSERLRTATYRSASSASQPRP